jgi:ribonuclease D
MTETTAVKPAIHLHHNDLPAGLSFGAAVAIDTETMGLNPKRDRLCLVQLSAGDGVVHLVHFDGKNYAAPVLKKLLADTAVTKIFHFARFDLGILHTTFGLMPQPVYCTKVASRLARTFTQGHSLKNLCKDLLGIDLDKQQQTTDWGAPTLSPEQMDYAAADVLYLHRLKDVLDGMLKREKRDVLAAACQAFVPTRALLDVSGWPEEEFFAHH